MALNNKRIEYRTPIQIIVDHLKPSPTDGTVKGYIREISASGVRIDSELPLAVDQEIQVSFVLAGGQTVVNARVKVIRVLKKARGRVTVAGEFVGLPEEDQYKIREFIVWQEAQEEKSK